MQYCCVSNTVMPKEKRRGRPRGSRAQNYQKNADGKDISSNNSEAGMVQLYYIRIYLNLKKGKKVDYYFPITIYTGLF